MNIDATAIRAPLARFPTRVPGLDTVLRGGLFRGGVYMVQGCPGAGKTILVNQICLGAVAEGAHCVYMTLLAESHSRLIQQLQSLQFFDRTAIPSHITYLSAFRQLQQDGLQGILVIAQSEVARTGATVLVIDGLSVAAEAAQSLQEMKRLVHDLQALASMQDCTVFLLASTDETLIRAEDTMVDGIIRLESNLVGPQPDQQALEEEISPLPVIDGAKKPGHAVDDEPLHEFIDKVIGRSTPRQRHRAGQRHLAKVQSNRIRLFQKQIGGLVEANRETGRFRTGAAEELQGEQCLAATCGTDGDGGTSGRQAATLKQGVQCRHARRNELRRSGPHRRFSQHALHTRKNPDPRAVDDERMGTGQRAVAARFEDRDVPGGYDRTVRDLVISSSGIAVGEPVSPSTS